jgi:hypothetical protein
MPLSGRTSSCTTAIRRNGWTLFEEQPLMIRVETGHYIKALHNLLNAHFDLRNYQKFERVLQKFEDFSQTDRVIENDNFRIQSFVYITTAKINQVFMKGTFREGLLMVPGIENGWRNTICSSTSIVSSS